MKFFAPKTLQLTLALIKPHAAQVPLAVRGITDLLINNGYFIVKWKRAAIDEKSASVMYEEHVGKPFYGRLLSMMTSGPIESFILARKNAIQHWRKMMGPTRALETQFTAPETIRGLYGVSNTRNATHGSDSPDSAAKEIAVFFPDFNINCWYKKEEVYFRNGYVKYIEDEKIHIKEECDAPQILFDKKF